MNTLIRAASRIALGPVKDKVFSRSGPAINKFIISKRWAHNIPLTYDFARERIMLVLHLYDKIDPNKLTLDAHFEKDLGLDSLDHMDIVMQIEDEFQFEIPDQDVDRLLTPRDIVTYITDKEEAYEELQQLSHHHHHDHDHGHDNNHSHHGDHKEHDQNNVSAGIHNNHTAIKPQIRSFCTTSARFDSSGEKKIYETSFNTAPAQEINFDDIQNRVMKVLSKYDKIDSSQLQLASHFVNDLGLDSLDHVEIMMELEDEFGIEIPDQEAEKLLRPSEVARFIFQKESERVPKEQDRPF